MKRMRALIRRAGDVLLRNRRERELAEELHSHLALHIADNLRAGMAAEEARRQALIALGGIEQTQEAVRERRGLPFLETLWQDARYGRRVLSKSPGFTIVAVITLALGIGGNTAIFSLIDAVLFRGLPAANPQQLVVLQWSAHKPPLFHSYNSYGYANDQVTPSEPVGYSFCETFVREVESAGVFSGVAAFSGGEPITLTGNGDAQRAWTEGVSGDAFDALGVRAASGRLLAAGDDRADAAPVAVLSYAFWRREFGGSPQAVGRVLNLNGVPFTIVGVVDRSFPGLTLGSGGDLWITFSGRQKLSDWEKKQATDPQSWFAIVVGRLKPGVPRAQAQAVLDTRFRSSLVSGAKPLAQEQDKPRIRLVDARTALQGSASLYKPRLLVLMSAVGLLLLIACANVAGLSLARAAARRREFAVRLALGARRSRVFRQLLTESVLLSLLAGTAGILLAIWAGHGVAVLLASTPDGRPVFDVRLDWRVLGVTAAISLGTGILFGLAPALRSINLDLAPAIKEGGAGAIESRSRWISVGNALVVLQATLAVVILMGAGLLVHTLFNLRTLDPGFETRRVLLFSLDPTQGGRKGKEVDSLYQEVEERIRTIPGVRSVSYSQTSLLSGSWSQMSMKYAPPGGARRDLSADYLAVAPDFFATMGIPLVEGRGFAPQDTAAAAEHERLARLRGPGGKGPLGPPLPAVVNQMLVQQYFAGTNPIGQTIGESDGSDPDDPYPSAGYLIVGVVADTHYSSLRREIKPMMFVPVSGQPATFAVRSETDPRSLMAPVRKAVAASDRNLPLTNVQTQTDEIEQLLQPERMIAELSTAFGLLALTLASVGLYGLLSYEVTRRTREIGIRMALGARRGQVLRLVVSQGVVLAAMGVLAGVATGMALSRLLTNFLFGVRVADPGALAAAVLLLAAVAAAASYVPGRRATRVDPMIALRFE